MLVTGGGGESPISCNQTQQSTTGLYSYHGESNQSTWLLDGVGETFPFDSYILHFTIQTIDHVDSNFTLASTGHLAVFSGAKAYSLDDLWTTSGNSIPISSISSTELDVSIIRSGGALWISILEFLVPTIACFYLLGATLILDPEKQLSDRLQVYVALFVFAPVFLFAIRDFLPYRSTLSLPELLLVNLVLTNAVFAVISIVGRSKAPPAGPQIIRLYSFGPHLREWDVVGVVVSLLFFVGTYILTIMPKVNVPTSWIIAYLIIPGYICALPFLMTRRQFVERWHHYLLIIMLALIPAALQIIIWLLLHI